MPMIVRYELTPKNGRTWMRYTWREGHIPGSALFLRTGGAPPTDGESIWIAWMHNRFQAEFRPLHWHDPADRSTSLDTLETSVSAKKNLF
jgi:hypothetical protein